MLLIVIHTIICLQNHIIVLLYITEKDTPSKYSKNIVASTVIVHVQYRECDIIDITITRIQNVTNSIDSYTEPLYNINDQLYSDKIFITTTRINKHIDMSLKVHTAWILCKIITNSLILGDNIRTYIHYIIITIINEKTFLRDFLYFTSHTGELTTRLQLSVAM